MYGNDGQRTVKILLEQDDHYCEGDNKNTTLAISTRKPQHRSVEYQQNETYKPTKWTNTTKMDKKKARKKE